MSTPTLISIHRDGQEFGPYTEDQVKQHIASGNLASSDLAWHLGMTEWQTLGSIPELSACVKQPAATPLPEALRTQPDPLGQSQGSVPKRNRSSPIKKKIKRVLITVGLVITGSLMLPSFGGIFLIAGFVAIITIANGASGNGGGSDCSGSSSSCSSCGGGD